MDEPQKGIIEIGNGLYHVLSSKGDKWYEVNVIDGNCECKGFGYRGECRHLRECKKLYTQRS